MYCYVTHITGDYCHSFDGPIVKIIVTNVRKPAGAIGR